MEVRKSTAERSTPSDIIFTSIVKHILTSPKLSGQADMDSCLNVHSQVDYEMALEYATHSGVKEEPKESIYIQSLEADKNQFIDFRSPIFVFRLFQ